MSAQRSDESGRHEQLLVAVTKLETESSRVREEIKNWIKPTLDALTKGGEECTRRFQLLENEVGHMKTSIEGQNKTVSEMESCIEAMTSTLHEMQVTTAAQKKLIFGALAGFAAIATLVVAILQWLGGS